MYQRYFRIILASFLFIVGIFIGGKIRRILYRSLMGYQIDSSASIGNCFIDVGSLSMEAGSKIGGLTVIRNLKSLAMGEDSKIGTFNWIFGYLGSEHFEHIQDRSSCLSLATGASITSRHIVDCTDKVLLGEYSIVAGYRTQLLTHSIDLALSRQDCGPITIGERSFVGTGCIILKGSKIGPSSVVAAGSVYSKVDETGLVLWGGVPATCVRSLSPEMLFFKRQNPHVN